MKAVKAVKSEEDLALDAVALQWAETYGEALDCERMARYCDPETGDVRS